MATLAKFALRMRVLTHMSNYSHRQFIRVSPTTIRNYSLHQHFNYPEIPTKADAKGFVLQLDDKGRTLLLKELTEWDDAKQLKEIKEAPSDPETQPISKQQFKDVIVFHGLPFIGFGILDNMIMIIAGEYIDLTIGVALGISTMAAAALGNLVSDLAGVGTAGYVELLAHKVGVKPPDLTPFQALSWQVRWGVALGRSLGIAVGCVIGMFPLLFYKNKENTDDTTADSETSHTDISPSIS